MREFNYFSLVKKIDDKEVYTSPEYLREDSSNVFDVEKIQKTLNYYFERVNSGIEQQMNSPKMTEEQKKNLKLLEKKDYVVKFKRYTGPFNLQPVFWTKEAEEFLK